MSSSPVFGNRGEADGQDGKERTLHFCFRGELGTGVTWTLFPGQLGRPPATEQPQPQHVSRWEGWTVSAPGAGSPARPPWLGPGKGSDRGRPARGGLGGGLHGVLRPEPTRPE